MARQLPNTLDTLTFFSSVRSLSCAVGLRVDLRRLLALPNFVFSDVD